MLLLYQLIFYADFNGFLLNIAPNIAPILIVSDSRKTFQRNKKGFNTRVLTS